jgi:hypothetical protein
MPGGKDYTREELDHSKAAIKEQLAVYKELASEIESGSANSRRPLR